MAYTFNEQAGHFVVWHGQVYPLDWPDSLGSFIPLSQGEARPGLVQGQHWGCRAGYYPGYTADILLAMMKEGLWP